MMNSWSVLLAVVAGIAFVTPTNGSDCSNETQDLYHSDGPQITPCQKEIILQNGENYTLICRANTPVEFIQQEPAEELVETFFNITEKNSTDENGEYKYEAQLEFTNIDRYAIGFYACIRKGSTIDRDILEHLVAEPNNTADISYIYIYVNGTDSLFAPMREVIMGKKGYYVAECKPTTPDVEVTITMSQTKTPKYLRFSPKIGYVMEQCSKIAFQCVANKTGFRRERKKIRLQLELQPTVTGDYKEFLAGDLFVLNCSAHYTENSAVHLRWLLPNNSLKVKYDSNNDKVTGGIVYLTLTVEHATKEHEGNYTCLATNHCGERGVNFTKIYVDEPYLKAKLYDKNFIKETRQPAYTFSVQISSFPPANYTFYKNKTKLESNDTFMISKNSRNEVILRIRWRNVEDSDLYTLKVTNGYKTIDNITYDIRFKEKPTVNFDESNKTCVLNSITSLQCKILGYPLPDVEWIFNGIKKNSANITVDKLYQETAIFKISCRESGLISCNATNDLGSTIMTRRLLVYELPGGFGIYDQPEDKIIRFSEGQLATVKCVASIHHFSNVTWEKDGQLITMVEYTRNEFSFVAKLRINNTSLNDSGNYTCRGIRFNGITATEEIEIKVSALEAPEIIFTHDVDGNVQTYQPINMYCQAEGIPRPEIIWTKDNTPLKPENTTNIELKFNIVDYKTVNSSIFIAQMKEENRGEYECFAKNSVGAANRSAILTLKEAAYMKYVIAIAIIVLILVILVIYLTCKVKKEKRFRKELAAAGLLYFKEGVTKSLNPDLGIDEQAELLPYNEKFEFPADKLVFGKQLGAGAFGVVYKAEARGIINAEETTPVAVKMVKKTADNMYIKALASELKIMVHLGKHINIVNLLGACTKNVGKRELVVIVEYCKFGNIHNYMQRHREVFIDQFSDTNKEKSFGKVNRGYDSSGSTGIQSDYGTANTQDTDHTFLTNNTNRTSRKTSEGYVQPEWRSNYESDYSYDGRNPRPLTSRDLLAWAFQIARGMEYLASRKVLHGDLAARNILLADDNIVKICDFGLARSIYKNDEYQKKENSLLPVKWLAIECMTDRIFSTQSDVWSFGIVLWELFTLAKTPYPNMSPAHLLQFLREGHRLEKPAYSDDRIYNLMKRCWEEKPTTRPSFTQLQETLGTFLEDNVRNHYVDLNTAYMDGNAQPAGQEDYLAMVSAPDYNNMVTPSPHHYVNDHADPRRFFPPSPSKVDEDGYLQMSPAHIFSPKSTSTNFDFDPRKFNTRASEASSGGSELTPMLTLNNLPRSGSDSDHEGNVSDPFPNVCPRIDEEPDEVFDSKQNKKTLNQNAKNAQITNATNPMYITFDMDVHKKPIDNNSYVNIVPNGLVK